MGAYIDGWPGRAVAISNAPCAYPFRKYGDISHAVFVRKYQQALACFTPTAVGTPDEIKQGFFLVDESTPGETSAGMAEFTRTYATIPGKTVSPGTTRFTRPNVPGSGQYRAYGSEAAGNAGLFYQPNTTRQEFKAHTLRAVASDSGFSSAPSGGTYTLSMFGGTTSAIAYNATAATAASALSAIPAISNAGCLVSGSTDSSGSIVFSYGGDLQSIESPVANSSIDLATLAVSGGYVSKTASEFYYDATLGRNVANARVGFDAFQKVDGVLSSISISTVNLTTKTHLPTFELSVVPNEYNQAVFGVFWPVDNVGGVTSNISGGHLIVAIGGIATNVYFNGSEWQNTIQDRMEANGVSASVRMVAPYPFTGLGDSGEYGKAANGISITGPYIRKEPTSGNFTLNWGASNISIAHNATQAAIVSAIQAMSQWAPFVAIGGTLSVARTTGKLRIAMYWVAGTLTITPSLTPASAGVSITANRTLSLLSGSVPRVVRTTYPHGLTGAESLYLKQGGAYTFGVSGFSVLDSTGIVIQPGTSGWTATAITELGAFVCDYAAGPRTYATQEETLYWLPGVSAGIATAADIPMPVDDITDGGFLDALFAPSDGFVTIRSSDLREYLGAIVARTETRVRIR